MPSDYDATEFIDGDFQTMPSPGSAAVPLVRAPTREEVDSRVTETQQKLVELRRAQEELERERAALEETRRRQLEFQTSRQEMIQNLTRGVGLLEEGEFNARRDAEQMAKALVGLRDALTKIQSIHEDTWTQQTFQLELTRALTAIENAQMEWNAARLKCDVLAGVSADPQKPAANSPVAPNSVLLNCGFGQLCRLGFALSWPVAAVILVGFVFLLVLQLRH
jgi:chromosome segregation ATPase